MTHSPYGTNAAPSASAPPPASKPGAIRRLWVCEGGCKAAPCVLSQVCAKLDIPTRESEHDYSRGLGSDQSAITPFKSCFAQQILAVPATATTAGAGTTLHLQVGNRAVGLLFQYLSDGFPHLAGGDVAAVTAQFLIGKLTGSHDLLDMEHPLVQWRGGVNSLTPCG